MEMILEFMIGFVVLMTTWLKIRELDDKLEYYKARIIGLEQLHREEVKQYMIDIPGPGG